MSTLAHDPRKTATIIWGALLAGLLIFLVVATIALPSMRPAPPDFTRVFALAVSLLAVVDVTLSRVIPRFIRKLEGTTADQHALRKNIVAASLCEGAGLFAVMAWLITASPLVLPALALSLLGLVACFPGPGRWESLGGTAQ